MSVEPQLHDTVFVDGQPLRIVAFSEDDGTKLSDGRWVCASKFVSVTRAAWRYEPTSKPVSARDILVTTLTNLRAVVHRGRMGEHRAHAERLVDEALKEHAHELAEAARHVMGPRVLPSGAEPERVARYVVGWHDAADHFDPEVP